MTCFHEVDLNLHPVKKEVTEILNLKRFKSLKS